MILMNINKIEKAMSMPDRYKIFSQDIVYQIIGTYLQNKQTISPILLNEICNTLYKYKNCLDDRILANKNIIEDIELFLSKESFDFSENITTNHPKENVYNFLSKLIQNRHTVRNFTYQKVEYSNIEKALNIANSLPSACNRQGCSLLIIKNAKIRQEILSIQQGNKGFTAPLLCAIVVDNEVFTQQYEQSAKYVHSGAFMAGLVLGLESLGLGSCILNWHVSLEKKEHINNLLDIGNKEIVSFIYIGYPKEGLKEAYSFKKQGNNLLEIKQ